MHQDPGFEPHILSSIIDGVILVSPKGTILHANLATEEMLRQSLEAFRGRPVTEFFPGQPEVEAKLHDTCTRGTSFRDIECRVHPRAGETPLPVSLTLTPYQPLAETIQGAVLLLRDRSLVQELEETSRQLDQISRLGVLSLGIAHEIKNPLVAISGSAQLLRSRLNDPDHRECLDVVIKEVNRINRMVERMLGLANQRPPDFKPINIHRVLEEIILLEKQSAGGSYHYIQQYDPSLPAIPGDEDQLKQVFLNLLRNAREAMPGGGAIRVSTRFRSEYSIKTRQHPSPHQDIVVEIQDEGVGISDQHLRTLFTPFHTTKPKGSGLGLPISLKIVEDHHGKIKVLSREGEGTRVQVFLPLEQESP